MFRRFLPQTIDFFAFFEEHSALTKEACARLVELFSPGADATGAAAAIQELEHRADRITQSCVTALHKTFITPFDRPQIHALMGALDDIMDFMNEAAARVTLYEFRAMLPEALELARLIERAVAALSRGLLEMRELKYAREIKEVVRDVHRLEHEGDEVLRRGLRKLFHEAPSPYLVIQWKEILELLEQSTDSCEDVADMIEGVIIEAS